MKSPTLENIFKTHREPAARYAAMKSNFARLATEAEVADAAMRNTSPVAANTYSATLVTSFLMDGSLTPLQNRWAALKAFTLDASTDPYKPKATGVLKNVTAAGATQTDATNFESGDSVVNPISVTMHQYTQSFNVSNSDLQSGLRMENLVTINIAAFANKVSQAATSLITIANFPTNPYLVAPGAFGFGDSATLQGMLKKSPIKNLVLDGEYIAQIANVPGFFQKAGTVNGNTNAWSAYGWDTVAALTDWSAAGANVRGIACHPQAIGGVLGLPLTPSNIPGNVLAQDTFVVPDLEISVALYRWFNTSTRTMWYSYDIMAGFSVGDATAGFVIKSA